MKKFKNIAVSIILALVGAVFIGVFVIFVLMLMIPSRDEEGHRLMPIFQFAMGWLAGWLGLSVFQLSLGIHINIGFIALINSGFLSKTMY